MRSVRVNLPLAIMLGLARPSTAFVRNIRPTHFMVPAHKYHAAVSRCRARPRAVLRNMRIMSSAVDVEADTDEVASPEEKEVPAAIGVAIPEAEGETVPELEIETTEEGQEETVAVAVEEAVADELVGGTDGAGDGGLVEAPEAEEAAPTIPLESIVVNEEYEGVVNNVVSYGAFVDIGTEVNGLVHISQLADEFVANCDDHVKDGDTVRVRVLNVDTVARKLVLSMRQKPRPSAPEQGDITKYSKMFEEDPTQFIPATVDNIVSYGAFLRLEDGCSGFVHISQMSPTGEHVGEVTDVLSGGQAVNVRIREVDEKLGRINLSLLPYGQGEVAKSSTPQATKDVSHLAGSDPSEFHKGTISAVQNYGLFVNIEGVDGLLHVSKISSDRSVTSENIHEKYSEGQEVEVRILDVNVDKNKMSLSMLPDKEDMDFSKYVNMPSDEWLDGTVVSLTNYGAFVRLEEGVDGMVHISQMDPQGQRVDSVYNYMQVGDPARVRVIESDGNSRRIRLTMRDTDYVPEPSFEGGGGGGGGRVIKRAKSVEKFLELSTEEWIDGTVASITNFGAFVAVDEDTDGLLHISQIAEDHVSNVEDYLQVGQDVQVRVIDVDVDNCRLGLSMREPRQSAPRGGGPREKKDVSVLLGRDPNEFIPGRVVSIVPYGAFVNVEGNIDGLVHISEMAIGRVDNVEDVVQMGQEIQVRISDVNIDNNTVNLSMVPASAYDGGGGNYDDDGYGGEGGRRRAGRGGGRGRSPRNSAAAFKGEDFADNSQGGDGSGADWQQFLNNYFDEKE